MNRLYGACALVLLFFVPSAFAATHYVPGDYPTIQGAIAASAAGDVILVAAGEYHERLTIPVSLQITGAGAGVTTLDADSGGRAVTITSATAVGIEGFTIREGSSSSRGAGIYGVGLALDLVSDDFSGNISQDLGGAVYIESGTATVTGCHFTGNMASEGAGVYFRVSDGLVNGCEFSTNQATRHAGGVYLYSASPTISNNTFSANTCGWRGAAICMVNSASPTVEGNQMLGNHSDTEGGAIWAGGNPSSFQGGIFTHNVMLDNTASVHGGGIYLYTASPTITDNVIARSTCSWRGGGICVVVDSAPVISGNTIYACSGSEGGGIYAGSETGVIDFHNNIVASCTDGSGVVDGDYPGSPPPALSCNDVWGNLPSDYLNIGPGPNDITADPLFCNPATDDYGLNAASPCAPAQQPTCGLIGAFPVTCGATAVTNTTWGRVKGAFAR